MCLINVRGAHRICEGRKRGRKEKGVTKQTRLLFFDQNESLPTCLTQNRWQSSEKIRENF